MAGRASPTIVGVASAWPTNDRHPAGGQVRSSRARGERAARRHAARDPSSRAGSGSRIPQDPVPDRSRASRTPSSNPGIFSSPPDRAIMAHNPGNSIRPFLPRGRGGIDPREVLGVARREGLARYRPDLALQAEWTTYRLCSFGIPHRRTSPAVRNGRRARFPFRRPCRRPEYFSALGLAQGRAPLRPDEPRLRCHLGIVVPPGCAIRVGASTDRGKKDGAIVFDDSFEHEVVERERSASVCPHSRCLASGSHARGGVGALEDRAPLAPHVAASTPEACAAVSVFHRMVGNLIVLAHARGQREAAYRPAPRWQADRDARIASTVHMQPDRPHLRRLFRELGSDRAGSLAGGARSPAPTR